VFSDQNYVCISLSSHACYIPSHLIILHTFFSSLQSVITTWQIQKLLK
jgi:hypothetical protein